MTEKWVTDSIYVDRDTGEIIDKIRIKRGEYIVITKTIKVRKNGNSKSKTITTECEENQKKYLLKRNN